MKTYEQIEAEVRAKLGSILGDAIKMRNSVAYVSTQLAIVRKNHPVLELCVDLLVLIRLTKQNQDSKQIDYSTCERIFETVRSIRYLSQMGFGDESELVDRAFICNNVVDCIIEEGDLVRVTRKEGLIV